MRLTPSSSLILATLATSSSLSALAAPADNHNDAISTSTSLQEAGKRDSIHVAFQGPAGATGDIGMLPNDDRGNRNIHGGGARGSRYQRDGLVETVENVVSGLPIVGPVLEPIVEKVMHMLGLEGGISAMSTLDAEQVSKVQQVISQVVAGLPANATLPVHPPAKPAAPSASGPPAPPAPPAREMFEQNNSSSASANVTVSASSTILFAQALEASTSVSPTATPSATCADQDTCMPPHGFPDPPANSTTSLASGPTTSPQALAAAAVPAAPAAPALLPVPNPTAIVPIPVVVPGGVPVSPPVPALPAIVPAPVAGAPFAIAPGAGSPSLPVSPGIPPNPPNTPEPEGPKQAYEVVEISQPAPDDTTSVNTTTAVYSTPSMAANSTDSATTSYPTTTPA
ncbi:hypothetical protein OBBRIDRAFT_800335 [Obba rivulosa]|uniref:Uncharacterized protein n=1 Tax=Obba rivulosa TaxID=1052685 RepID=A0A8E2DU87_9APHY|nr:hypothetical protein OBBRIDRAFT_800335 [Obba rivulosa]